MERIKDIIFSAHVPKYQQVVDVLEKFIQDPEMLIGDKLPSINEIASQYSLARETVVKAFRILEEKGLVKAQQGRGFFVAKKDLARAYRIFLLEANLNAYKLPMLDAIKKELSESGEVEFFFHHYNYKVFHKLITEAKANYTHYVISPFDHPAITESIAQLPYDRTFLIDRKPAAYALPHIGVWQHFSKDIASVLKQQIDSIKKYTCLNFFFRDSTTQPPLELVDGVSNFCKQEELRCKIITSMRNDELIVEKGQCYIVIDDKDMVQVVVQAKEKGLLLGRDLGLLSYNESLLKSVIGDGVSTISTDFEAMGKSLVRLIKEKKQISIENQCQFIDRRSF